MHSREGSKGQVTTQVTTQNHWRVPFSLRKFLKEMAGTTRLELATSAVTGQRSNQLNYVPNLILIVSNVFWAARVPAFWQEIVDAFLNYRQRAGLSLRYPATASELTRRLLR